MTKHFIIKAVCALGSDCWRSWDTVLGPMSCWNKLGQWDLAKWSEVSKLQHFRSPRVTETQYSGSVKLWSAWRLPKFYLRPCIHKSLLYIRCFVFLLLPFTGPLTFYKMILHKWILILSKCDVYPFALRLIYPGIPHRFSQFCSH